jgi:Caspase domain
LRPDDYALLVGIRSYPGAPRLAPLQGPRNDVEYFRSWLIDPQGGDMDPTHVLPLPEQEPPPPPAIAIDQYPPTQAEFYALFRRIVYDGGPAPIKRPNGRLYLFFSGHGFSDVRQSAEAAVYCGNAQPGLAWNISGTALAHWCVRAAVFGEVVLVMDCCRDAEVSKKLDPCLLDVVIDPGAKNVRSLEIYAVPYAEKAQERHFADRNRVHGLLTYTLVAALYGAPLARMGLGAAAKQARSGYALKQFIEGCWPDVAGLDGPEGPEIVLPKKGDICLSPVPPRAVPRRVRFVPPVAGPATLSVLGDLGAVLTAELNHAPASALVTPAGAPGVELPFDGNEIVLELQPQIYEARLEMPGAAPRTALLPMVGDNDVVV